jgi:hypothetical protein
VEPTADLRSLIVPPLKPATLQSTVLTNQLLLFLSLEIAIGELAPISAETHPKSYLKNINSANQLY